MKLKEFGRGGEFVIFKLYHVCSLNITLHAAPVDLARNKPTWQKSEDDIIPGTNGGSEFDTTGGDCHHFDNKKSPWWVVDLQSTNQITQVFLRNMPNGKYNSPFPQQEIRKSYCIRVLLKCTKLSR